MAHVRVPRGAAPYLAAGGFEHRAGVDDEDDVRRDTNAGHDALENCLAQAVASRAVALTALSHDDEAFGPNGGVVDAKRSHASLTDAGDRGGRILDLLRVDVVSAQHDEILHAPGDEQFVVGPVTEVA